MLTSTDQRDLKTYRTYLSDFSKFCREVLGYADMLDDHAHLCKFLQCSEKSAQLILMPRYSFKSCIATIGYSLWRLSRDDSLRILIYSDAVARSEGFLLEVKNHILGMKERSQFRKIFGMWEVDPKQGVWNQSAIVIKPRSTAHAEPSVDTAGLESSKVGAHYDLILFDDLVTRENVTTRELMEKTYQCYQAARSLLKPGGQVVVVGTRWHFGDMYGRLLAENAHTKQFDVFLRDAEVGPGGEAFPFAKIGLTKGFLAEQKRSQGTRLYSCLYRLSPQDDETAIFKAADFRFYQPHGVVEKWVRSLYITAVLDAIPPPTKDHGDDAAITVVGTDHEHTMFLLEAVAGRFHPDEQIERLLAFHTKWQFRKVGLETNAFQRMVKSDLERRLTDLRTQTNWQPFTLVEFVGTTQGNKEQRIQGLQPWHERGALRFPGTSLEQLTGDVGVLAHQMLQFPHAQKDDLLDSLSYHLQLKQLGSKTPVGQELPVTSAAWYEREIWRKQYVKELDRRPRWNRPPVPELAFS